MFVSLPLSLEEKKRVRKENLWRSVTVTRFTLQVASGYKFIYYTRTLFLCADNKKASLKIRPEHCRKASKQDKFLIAAADVAHHEPPHSRSKRVIVMHFFIAARSEWAKKFIYLFSRMINDDRMAMPRLKMKVMFF